MEDLSLCNQHTCIPMMLRGIYVAHTTKNFTYYVDIPFEENDANLTYVTDQLGKFIEYAEWKFPDREGSDQHYSYPGLQGHYRDLRP